MDDFHSKHMILEFLKKHTLAIIATCHRNGTPEAATVDFSVRDNLEIVFSTFKETRKFDNLAERPGVAFVVGWNDNITVQYEGEANTSNVLFDRLSGQRFQDPGRAGGTDFGQHFLTVG